MLEHKLPELLELERLIGLIQKAVGQAKELHLDVKTECEISMGKRQLPVYSIAMGNPDKDVPAVGFFGGIHGLERIGTQVLLSFLGSLLERLRWDHLLHQQLERVRLVFMPLINPGGMYQSTRCNPRGIDLMRNAPVDALDKVPFLLGGQRISHHLPWFRGAAGAPMEVENEALCRVVRKELLSRRFSIALDCHSGFGLRDRIWFPHAHTVNPILHLPDICALEDLFSQSYPNHNYIFEPQSRQYLTHGDVWDYLYLDSAGAGQVFLPLTLEMGSWLWVKKNPRQLFSRQGMFNPVARHRLQRVLRSHTVWLDFLARAACGHQNWLPQGEDRDKHQLRAYARWYPKSAPAQSFQS
ncbi:M14 family zinc carboxypeptidase [Undibacterium terreum]|uniref:Peptidase M14 n=1 Tax=Undibacterium terreum TaxID=1224302 RepID=A0A916XB98_9BURK|nr:M14 family zinc carboxypeptidase [Undibacterium terreum]GGC59136.1 peptidase M14 [Undibacterium terreum]